MSSTFSFNIEKLEKWSSDISEYGQLVELKKNHARRMTSIAKKAVDKALICTKDERVDFVVYASRHGELNLSSDIIQSIFAKDLPSPSKFSQSTHNVIGGLYCIEAEREIPSTAIAAGTESFKMGLVVASNYLLANPDAKVLFLFAEAIVPDHYLDKVEPIQIDKVVCALISSGKDFKFQLSDEISDL